MTTLGVEFVVFSPELDYIASPDLKDKEDVKVSSRCVLIYSLLAENIKLLFSYDKICRTRILIHQFEGTGL